MIVITKDYREANFDNILDLKRTIEYIVEENKPHSLSIKVPEAPQSTLSWPNMDVVYYRSLIAMIKMAKNYIQKAELPIEIKKKFE